MKVKFRNVFWSAAALAVVVMLAFAFRPQPLAVEVAQSTRGPMRVTVRDEGRTRVRNEYVVSAPLGGQLLRVENKPGDHVEAGETVARILPADPAFLDARSRAEMAAEVRSAEAALALAKAEAERAQAQALYARTDAARLEALRAQDLVSADAVDRARLELRLAEAGVDTARESVRVREAELEAARARLLQPGMPESTGQIIEVAAPVAGRVLRVAQESQSVIAGGAEIMTLGDPRDLEVVAELLSTDAVQVEPGAVTLIENWGRETPLRGRVRLVEPYGFLKISALGVEEQRVNVIIDFMDPPSEWAALGHGYRVEVAVVIWEADDVIQVPVSALFRDGDRWAVFRIESGRARLTPIEVGRDNGQSVQVRSGLDVGESIVLYPSEQMRDGVRVESRS
jgi:HlyD family secretion protein